MARIAGIQIEKNAKGIATHVRFDLKKHGAAIKPFLAQLGVLDEKDAFMQEWQMGGVSYKDAKKQLHQTIDKLSWGKT